MKAASKAQQWVEAGRSAQHAGRVADAAKAYQQALALDADHGPALCGLGEIWLQQGMLDAARAMFERAATVLTDDAKLWRSLGQLYERQAQPAKAADAYGRASILAPQDVATWGALARVQGRIGNADGARDAHEQLLRHAPNHLPSLMALVRDAYARNDEATVQRHYRAALACDARVGGELMPGFVSPLGQGGAASDPFPLLDVAPTADRNVVEQIVAGADLHILDDFLDDPDAARAWAGSLDYPASGNYPGQQTGPLPCADLMQRLADRLGQRIKWISPDNGVVRLTLADASARTDIHVDDEQAVDTNVYAAVLYLTPPEYCHGGTSFWRHMPTNWIKRPADADVRAAGYADFKTFLRRETPATQLRRFDELASARSDWQRLFTLPMCYNRLVLYKGNYFHAIDSIFGGGFDDGRLTRLFTFERY
ncbi:MAG: tetratricopeptide repeat protein [Burkholderiales bacterium]|nr:tetratricopeptide repeat protein [Burkholderiales bacterium]